MQEHRKIMHNSVHQVGDVGIRLVSNVDFQQSVQFPFSNNHQATLMIFKSEDRSILFNHPYNELIISTPNINRHKMRQLMCYLGDFNSEIYSAIHGGGIVVDGKGLLVVGGHGSGKTTVRNMFPNSRTLDDDLLMIDGKNMYVSGNLGSFTVEEDNGRKSLRYLEGSHELRESKINVVLLLDKSYPGGYSLKTSRCIPRSYSFIDALNPRLRKQYLGLEDIKVDSDVFILGTGDSPELTLLEIQKILNRKIDSSE